MKFTLSWLKKFLETDATITEIVDTLTNIGLEVEDTFNAYDDLKDFEIAYIASVSPHPDADKLQICQVQTSNGNLQIVCGAPNARPNIKVVLAKIGTIIPNGNFVIKQAKIRGVDSSGMLCSFDELGLAGDSNGIIEVREEAQIGENYARFIGLDDPVIEINITPNRGDALGVYGIARDLAAAGLGKLKPMNSAEFTQDLQGKISSKFGINIIEKKACPFFALYQISGVNNGLQTPNWLRSLLANIGCQSISPVVDITNYILFSYGQPMHAYDADKITGDVINIRCIDQGESEQKFTALNDKQYTLQKGDLVVEDSRKVVALAGIMGSKDSAIDVETTQIILECANFHPDFITNSGRRHSLNSDSRYRFERNVDITKCNQILNIAANMIIEICGGTASGLVKSGDDHLKLRSVEYSSSFLKNTIGLDLPQEKIDAILNNLGINKVNDKYVIPSWRSDISIKEDISEEIARIYGYNNVPTKTLPNMDIIQTIPASTRRISELRRICATLGFDEIVSFSFINDQEASLFAELREDLYLINPISAELNYMRPSLLPCLLKAVSKNNARFIDDTSFFEVGPVYSSADDENFEQQISAVRVGNNVSANIHSKPRAYDVFDIKADVAVLLDAVNLPIEKCQIISGAPSYYHPTRSAIIKLGKNIIGYFGQIHPDIQKKFSVKNHIVAFELFINNLPISKKKLAFRPDYVVSNYQAVNRDFAFIVDANTPVGNILSQVEKIDPSLVKKVELFDIYQGENIDKDKKSIAFSVILQSINKTLEESDITQISDKIISTISQKFDAKLRSF